MIKYTEQKKIIKISEAASHTVQYGYIYDGDILIDEVMVLLMKGPKVIQKKMLLKLIAMAELLKLKDFRDNN